jgi:molecular chaperone HtpG
VLLFTDRVDEWMLSHLYEFDGKPLQSVAKGAVDLGKLQDEDEKKAAEPPPSPSSRCWSS